MSISVQSGCRASANPPEDIQKNAVEQDARKTKTIQHLLSDWRTALNKSKKVKLLDLSSNMFVAREIKQNWTPCFSFIFLEHII